MAQERVRAVRGAIRVDEDAPEQVFAATERLLRAMLERNGIDPEDIVSVFFTATEDLRSAFPAEAARRMGLGAVPLMCAQEIPVRGVDAAGRPRPPALPHRARAGRDRADVPRRRGVAAR